MWHVPLQENLSLQHIGMANLKVLDYHSRTNLNFDFLFTLNAENCMIDTDRISLRDLNRFLKFWIKGSNPKLKDLILSFYTEVNTDWNVLLKGLKAKEAEAKGPMTNYIIENYRGVSAGIEIFHLEENAGVQFKILN
ncbi:unnamed protein product [Caenorhabditis nigoni]